MDKELTGDLALCRIALNKMRSNDPLAAAAAASQLAGFALDFRDLAVHQAYKSGRSVAEIAAELDLSRQAIYNILATAI